MDQRDSIGGSNAELAGPRADDVGLVVLVKVLNFFVVLAVTIDDAGDAPELGEAGGEGAGELLLLEESWDSSGGRSTRRRRWKNAR